MVQLGPHLPSRQSECLNDILGQRGMNVATPTPALMEALDRVSAEMVTEWLTRSGEDGARVIAQYRAARS